MQKKTKKPINFSGTEISSYFPDDFSATCGTCTKNFYVVGSLAIAVAVIVEPVFKKWESVPVIVDIVINPEKTLSFRFLPGKKY